MMRKGGTRPVIRLLSLALALAILLGAYIFLACNGSLWYPAAKAAVGYEPPALAALGRGEETQAWTIEALLEREHVFFSNVLMLVNESHPLPDGYAPDLTEYNGAKMNPLMVDSYISLRDAVQVRTGVRIYVSSDYRTSEEQAEILASSEEGIAAKLGCSEHEAGLALDVYAPYFAGEKFLNSPAGRMVNNVCGDYGYIIRYPKEKEYVTGIRYEPWHLRYVGEPHARIMMESGLTLEEYLDLLIPDVWYLSGEYLICRQRGETFTLPTGWSECHVSPDNTGYFVITLKMP